MSKRKPKYERTKVPQNFWILDVFPKFCNFRNVLFDQTSLVEYFKGACHNFLVAATEVSEIIQLVFNMELFAISRISDVRSEHKVCFAAFLRLTEVF